jgi:hypothetical protein
MKNRPQGKCQYASIYPDFCVSFSLPPGLQHFPSQFVTLTRECVTLTAPACLSTNPTCQIDRPNLSYRPPQLVISTAGRYLVGLLAKYGDFSTLASSVALPPASMQSSSLRSIEMTKIERLAALGGPSPLRSVDMIALVCTAK